jgi:hypothetical protein
MPKRQALSGIIFSGIMRDLLGRWLFALL